MHSEMNRAPFADSLPACIWVEFADKETGVKAQKIKGSARQYAQKGWTPIQPIDRTFAASRNNIMETCKQFPLVMSAARTIHKAQSATHQQIVVDMSGPTRAPSTFWETHALCCFQSLHHPQWTTCDGHQCSQN